MSAQCFRLHRPVHVFTALIIATLFALPPASAAAPEVSVPAELLLNATLRHAAVEPEPGAVAAVRFRIEIPEADAGTFLVEVAAPEPDQILPAFRLRLAFQATDSPATGRSIVKDVDPWDDDLGGKKPPASGGGTSEPCVPGGEDAPLCATPISSGEPVTGKLAAGRYVLEVESLNGDDTEYLLTLHRLSRR